MYHKLQKVIFFKLKKITSNMKNTRLIFSPLTSIDANMNQTPFGSKISLIYHQLESKNISGSLIQSLEINSDVKGLTSNLVDHYLVKEVENSITF